MKYSKILGDIKNEQINNNFDIVSDLHIDQWSTDYNNPYPC